MKALIYLFFLMFVTINGRLFEGQCRNIPAPVVFPFNYKWYLGTWYEVTEPYCCFHSKC